MGRWTCDRSVDTSEPSLYLFATRRNSLYVPLPLCSHSPLLLQSLTRFSYKKTVPLHPHSSPDPRNPLVHTDSVFLSYCHRSATPARADGLSPTSSLTVPDLYSAPGTPRCFPSQFLSSKFSHLTSHAVLQPPFKPSALFHRRSP